MVKREERLRVASLDKKTMKGMGHYNSYECVFLQVDPEKETKRKSLIKMSLWLEKLCVASSPTE